MKTYIGDSVYAELDGCDVTLTTENGSPDDPSNRIVLEPEVWRSLVAWVERAQVLDKARIAGAR